MFLANTDVVKHRVKKDLGAKTKELRAAKAAALGQGRR